MSKLDEKDYDLLKAFIHREHGDYSFTRGDDWEEKLFDKVKLIINKKPHINYITIRSIGNIGTLSRTLTLDVRTDYRNVDYTKLKSYNLDFCSCGSLNHTCFLSEVVK